MRRFHFGKVIGLLVIAAGLFVFSGIVMLLWNALMPDLFHLPLVTFWQALGLLILTKILFGGFRRPGFGGFGGRRGAWKNKMREQWMNMTPEEKERFRQNWGRRCRNPFEEERYGGQGASPGQASSGGQAGSPSPDQKPL
jgi:Ca2+/H+ antiporter, TMEM165/GDT1 family